MFTKNKLKSHCSTQLSGVVIIPPKNSQTHTHAFCSSPRKAFRVIKCYAELCTISQDRRAQSTFTLAKSQENEQILDPLHKPNYVTCDLEKNSPLFRFPFCVHMSKTFLHDKQLCRETPELHMFCNQEWNANKVDCFKRPIFHNILLISHACVIYF